MARGMDFRKPRLAEYTAPSSLYLCRYPPDVSHCSQKMQIKIQWKLPLVGFSCDRKSANVVMWKDKEYEYISSA